MNRTGSRITDEMGRTLILRGVNLGGSSKIPAQEEPLSFTGRPFPLEKAEEHFDRLKSWGFTFIRFIITWEALEHAGPGIYDESYLSYLRKILLVAEKKGISVFMDPHQDAWSRWTGGDGAPAWTMEKLGLETGLLGTSGAAINPLGSATGKATLSGAAKNPKGAPKNPQKSPKKPQMIWPVNYSLYAAATMFTLFFGGNAFAPSLQIEGKSAQDWLQDRYLAAFRHCFRRLKNCKAIVGWGAMNEPHPGFIGNHDLNHIENAALLLGPVPSPYQAMLAASGKSVEASVYTPWIKGWKQIGKKTINPHRVSIFKRGFACPWEQAGVWTDKGNSPKLLKPDHFSTYNGKPVNFSEDFLKPFLLRFINSMQEAGRPVLYFIEGIPHGENPTWGKKEFQNTVNAFHHYDGLTLFAKSFRPWLTADPKAGKIILGKKNTASHYSSKLAEARAWTREQMGDMPCLLGEFGLPFDLNNGKAYKTGDYQSHETALSLYYDAIDENLLSSTIWNYAADNTNEDGDHWNGEDLSIVSVSLDGKVEGRAMGGWLRPYPMATAGIPLKITWDRKMKVFYFQFRSDPAVTAPTEIFLPSLWFGEKLSISVKTNKKEGELRIEYQRQEQRLLIYNDGYAGETFVLVSN